MQDEELVKIAIQAREGAYAPYSGFRVGAALLTKSGKLYTGVNIENVSYGASNCAERTAVFKAVSEGERQIAVIAVASDSTDYVFPCGICRQVLAEFCGRETRILCSTREGRYKVFSLEEILPSAFDHFPGKGDKEREV